MSFFLNYSGARLFWSCHRKWALSRLFGLKSKQPADYFITGMAIHAGMSTHYSGGSRPESMISAFNTHLSECRRDDGGPELEEWKEDAEYSAKVVGEYIRRDYPQDDFTVISTEETHSVVLGECCYQCGQLYEGSPSLCSCGAQVYHWVGTTDMKVKRLWQGEEVLGILDHKTTGSTPSDEWLAGWANSFQLLGYTYLASKASGEEYKFYGVNALQKAATIGEEAATTKACPECRNGKVKKLKCVACGGAGRITKVTPLRPFRRMWFPVCPSDIDRFVLFAHRTVASIVEEIKKLVTDPKTAFPMNDQWCKRCEFKELCWGSLNPTKWHEIEEISDGMVLRPEDYVDKAAVAKEEMI